MIILVIVSQFLFLFAKYVSLIFLKGKGGGLNECQQSQTSKSKATFLFHCSRKPDKCIFFFLLQVRNPSLVKNAMPSFPPNLTVNVTSCANTELPPAP